MLFIYIYWNVNLVYFGMVFVLFNVWDVFFEVCFFEMLIFFMVKLCLLFVKNICINKGENFIDFMLRSLI